MGLVVPHFTLGALYRIRSSPRLHGGGSFTGRTSWEEVGAQKAAPDQINVIRAWLGHVNLATTKRYAEITTPMKEAALRACEPPPSPVGPPRKPAWHDDRALLKWLESL